MHPIQESLLDLSRRRNLAKLSLRQIAEEIGLSGESPQKIKHHLQQLEKRGFLVIDRVRRQMDRAGDKPGWVRGPLTAPSRLFMLPIIGTANCGPATIYAEENFRGFLRVSSKLIGRSQPTGLYALKTDGSSMNKAEVGGRKIEDGDYVVVDRRRVTPQQGDVVVAIIDGKATVKRFIDDRPNGQIVLKADSSFDYEPIHLHPDDEFSISGTVIGVVKRPA
jgi:repressor LexA